MAQFWRAFDRAWYRLGRVFLRKTPPVSLSSSTFTISLPNQELLEQISEFEKQYHIIRRLWVVPSMRLPKYWNRRRLWEQVDELKEIIAQLDDHRRGIEDMVRLLSEELPGASRQQSPSQRRKANASSARRVPGAYPVSNSGLSVKSSLLGPTPTDDQCPLASKATVGKLLNGYLETLKQTRDDVDMWRRLLREIADAV